MDNSSNSTFEAPCPYLPLSEYDWTLNHPKIDVPKHCGGLPWNPLVFCLIAAFNAVTLWIAFELLTQLLLRFKRRWTTYFCSILISISGTVVFCVANLASHWGNVRLTAGYALTIIGWVSMVTGFSMVLYSRLGVLINDKRHLRIILSCIITNAIIFHTLVIVSGQLTGPKAPFIFKVTSSFEIIFSVQEIVLSSLYIYNFSRLTMNLRSDRNTSATLLLLIIAEAIVVSGDIIQNVLLYMEYYLPREMMQTFSYAIKIKIEFVVLNSLVKYSRSELALGALQSPPSDRSNNIESSHLPDTPPPLHNTSSNPNDPSQANQSARSQPMILIPLPEHSSWKMQRSTMEKGSTFVTSFSSRRSQSMDA